MGRRTGTAAADAVPRARARGPALRRRLLRWYERERRDLPWRRTRDPYAIWIAETMLQQTRSETVLRYFAPFLARFPTPAALARAPERRVLAAWSGLGYYGRARNLRRAARLIVERHGGRLPSDPGALVALPGVGRYTLGAIASIAFDRSLPLVDGNVVRVFARLFALERPLSGTDRELWAIASALVPRRRAGEWNQALMELGATTCTARDPHCGACPVAPLCDARVLGRAGALPRPRPRPAPRLVRRAAVVVEQAGRVLLVRHDDGALLRGLWDVPSVDLAAGDDPETRLRALLEMVGVGAQRLREAGTIRHAILDRRIVARVFHATASTPASPPTRWISRSCLPDHPLTAGATHALHLVSTRGTTPGNHRPGDAASSRLMLTAKLAEER